MADPILLGVDVGGTFTDLAAVVDGEVGTTKVSSTPHDQSIGVVRALRAARLDHGAVGAFAHGTTVATNALLERQGARVALVTTHGHRDIIEIGRQARPSLYDLAVAAAPPLVPRELRYTVRERIGPNGVLLAPSDHDIDAVVASLRAADVDAVAVCFLFSFLDPSHEQLVGARLRAELPAVHVSLSSDVLREFREYERFATTTANAYLSPVMSRYLDELAGRLGPLGVPAPHVMQSSGGTIELATAGRSGAACVLSGPAGGVVGAGYVAALAGATDVLTFDMGGTSTDVAAIVGGRIETASEGAIAGVPIHLPHVAVHTVSAGGGSMAWIDDGGGLRVGPRSAGAVPGPVCYGRGGTAPTVTDANVHLGVIGTDAVLGGEVRIDRAAADNALARLGKRLGLSAGKLAHGIVEIANAEMVRALRVITVERGLDPRRFAMVAFGGAGGMHACAIAAQLGVRRILVPKACGVLSAVGLAVADARRDYSRPLLADCDALDPGALDTAYRSMEARAHDELPEPVSVERRADARYRGQSFELAVPVDRADTMAERFHRAHEERFGYRMDGQVVEVVNLRVVATSPTPKPALTEPVRRNGGRVVERRLVLNDGRPMKFSVFHRHDLGARSQVEGPAIIEFGDATCLVEPGWAGAIDRFGTLALERQR